MAEWNVLYVYNKLLQSGKGFKHQERGRDVLFLFFKCYKITILVITAMQGIYLNETNCFTNIRCLKSCCCLCVLAIISPTLKLVAHFQAWTYALKHTYIICCRCQSGIFKKASEWLLDASCLENLLRAFLWFLNLVFGVSGCGHMQCHFCPFFKFIKLVTATCKTFDS